MYIRIIILSVLIASAASAQSVEFVRPVNDISKYLTAVQQSNLEKSLKQNFPIRRLRHTAHETAAMTSERITYDLIKQHGSKYAIVIFAGSWKSEVSQLAIFRIGTTGYPTKLYRSWAWHSNFTDTYHEIKSMPFGNANVILIKEGEIGKSPYVIASLFTFRDKRATEEHSASFAINDLTPSMPRLKVHVGFPLKALYAQEIKMEKNSDYITLQAADVEFSWQHNPASGMMFWKYDKSSRKFNQQQHLALGN
jgi:hypothetical protein